MPCTRNKSNETGKQSNKSVKRSTRSKSVDMENINSNHVTPSSSTKREKLNGIKKQIKSVVYNVSEDKRSTQTRNNTETVRFQEDGEMIDMETSDGGAAALDFKSDEEGELNSDNSDGEEMDQGSDDEPDGNDDETTKTDGGNTSIEEEDMKKTSEQSDSDCDGVTSTPPAKKKKSKSKKARKQSVEEQISSLSSSMKMMQDMLLESGLLANKDKGNKKDKKKNQTGMDDETDSDTMIYQNVLEKIDDSEEREIVVDN